MRSVELMVNVGWERKGLMNNRRKVKKEERKWSKAFGSGTVPEDWKDPVIGPLYKAE